MLNRIDALMETDAQDKAYFGWINSAWILEQLSVPKNAE